MTHSNINKTLIYIFNYSEQIQKSRGNHTRQTEMCLDTDDKDELSSSPWNTQSKTDHLLYDPWAAAHTSQAVFMRTMPVQYA